MVQSLLNKSHQSAQKLHYSSKTFLCGVKCRYIYMDVARMVLVIPDRKRIQCSLSKFCPHWDRCWCRHRCPWSCRPPCGIPLLSACQMPALENYTWDSTGMCISQGACPGLCSHSACPQTLLWPERSYRKLWCAPLSWTWHRFGCLCQ